MLTYAIVGLLWGLIAYDMPADASSLFGRMMVSCTSLMQDRRACTAVASALSG